MRRAALALALLLAPALAAQEPGAAYKLDQVAVRLDGQAGGAASYAAMTPPSGCVATSVPIFLGSPVRLGCDAGLTYDAATDTLTVGAGGVSSIGGFRTPAAGGEITGNSIVNLTKYRLTGAGSAFIFSDDFALQWRNNSDANGGAPDLGLARAAAGVLKVTDGSTGNGSITAANGVTSNYGVFGISLRVDTGGTLQFRAPGTYVSSPADATLQLGKAPNATPVANTLIVGESGSGTDIAGANGVIQSGAGTGAGAGSTLEFKTPTEGGSGAGAQTQTTRIGVSQYGLAVHGDSFPNVSDTRSLGTASGLDWKSLYLSRATLGSKSKAVPDNTATGFATIPMADGVATGGKLIYRYVVTSGTSRQVVSGSINYAAVRDGATYVVDYDEIQQSTAVTAGTLTGSVTAAGASDLLTFTATFDSSLDVAGTLYYRFDSTDTLAITPL